MFLFVITYQTLEVIMWSRKELKTQGKAAFKLNYWKCVIVSIILSMLTAATVSVSYNEQLQQNQEQQAQNLLQQIQSMPQQQQIALAAGVAGGLTIIIIVSILLKIFVYNPLLVGCYSFFTKNVQDGPADLGSLSVGFRDYGHTFVTLFLRDLFIALWTCLFIIPGIIKSFSYRLVPYIIADHPELSATETLALSKNMMYGHKWKAFVLDLSFIGWILLSVLTLGLVGIFWYEPYQNNTDAALYLAIKEEYNR